MLSLLASLAGFVTAAFPEIMGFLRDKGDKAHELAVMEKQAELGLKQAEAQRETAAITSASTDFQSAQESYRAEIRAAKTSWVAAFSATVRPVATYLLLLEYIGIKVFFASMADPSLPWTVEKIWGEEDAILLGWVMGFWFGQRSFKR